MGYIVVAVLAVAVAVFAMQNTDHVVVKFLLWEIANVPVAAVVLASFGVGILTAGIPAWFKVWRLQRRLIRAQQTAVPPDQPFSPPPDPPPSRPFGV
ncbi:MAG: LapA family protein [Candidatus Rokuibacteriota bacterium]